MRCIVVSAALAFVASNAVAQPTYSREVSRIMQAKCQRCHRAGDIAPFELASYQDAKVYASAIKHAVENRIMPPWKPVAGHGEFRDNFGLTDEERSTILQWVDAGVPEGNPADLPEALPPRGDWDGGAPDLIVKMQRPFEVPEGKDLYRCFVLPTGLTEDQYVRAVEIKPGNRSIVHHVIVFVDSTGEAEKLDAADEQDGYTCFGGPGIDLARGGITAAMDLMSTLGGWAPGMRPQPLPDGVGLALSRKARIVMQVHYHPGDTPSPDQTEVGLYFVKTPVERRMLYVPVVNTSFEIPPGAEKHEVHASLPVLPFMDAKVIQIVPHMHNLGREIRVWVERGRDQRPLIYIDDWDFYWQSFYTYLEPVSLKGGDTVRLTCTYNNSGSNEHLHDRELKPVRWGEGTDDEMCVTFLGVTFDRFNLLPFAAPQQAQ